MSVSKEHADWVPLPDLSAREVFELMLGCQLKPLEAAPGSGLDITSMVGLAGQLCGVLSVRSSKESAASMANKMLGEETDKNSQEVRDAFESPVPDFHEKSAVLRREPLGNVHVGEYLHA